MIRGSPALEVEPGKYDVLAMHIGENRVHLLMPQPTFLKIHYFAFLREQVSIQTDSGVKRTTPLLVAEKRNGEMAYTIFHAPD